jgi:hypothetical protein
VEFWGVYPSVHPKAPGFDFGNLLRTSFLLPILYAWQFCLNQYLVWSLGFFKFLSREEAHTAFVNVLYFKHRLQASEFATNFAGTLLFALGFDLSPEPGVFYGRMLKSIVMASVPCLCFLLMQLRFEYSKWISLWCALAVGLVPGLYFFYGLGIDIGLEIPFGLAALILAGSQRLWVVGVAGALLMFSALCYGAGIAFGPAVAWYLIRHPDWKKRIPVAALGGLIVVGLAVVYWTNVQLLFVGGGGAGKATPWESFLLIRNDLMVGGGSYYYPLNGKPALGLNPLPWVAILGLASAAARWRRLMPLVLVAVSSILLASAAGTLPGVRRALPLVLVATVLGVCFLDHHLQRIPRIKMAIGVAVIAGLLIDLHLVTQEWQAGRLFVAQDFEFGQKGSSLASYRGRDAILPDAKSMRFPRSSYAILHLLTFPNPAVSFESFADVQDQDDPPFPKGATRFSLLAEIWKRRSQPATSSSGR